LCFYRSR